MSQPDIEPGLPRWEASTLEKSHLNSLLTAIRNSARPVENARNVLLNMCKQFLAYFYFSQHHLMLSFKFYCVDRMLGLNPGLDIHCC
jgi:hypothetical protein